MSDKIIPEKLTRGTYVDLRIGDLAYGGKSVAKIDGFVIFVDKGIPGDLVRARITKKSKNMAEADLVEILEPSPKRIDSPCPLFGQCGGCSWHNISYEEQLVHKQRQAESILQHLGKAKPETILPIIPSPVQWRYRNKMEYTFGSDDRGDPIIGFHHPGAFDRILEVPSCMLQPESLDALVGALGKWVRAQNLRSYDPRTHQGFLRHLLMRHSVATGEVVAVLLTNHGDLPDKEGLVETLRKACPGLKGLIWGLNAGKADIARLDRELWLWGEPWIEEKLEDLTYKVSALSFFQVNTRAAERLYGVVRDMLGDDAGNQRLLDAYCGTGTIGIFCAKRVKEVVGIEILRDAIWDARENASRNAIANCTFMVGSMRDALPLALQIPGPSFGRIIVDPPRGGMDKHSLRGLLDVKAPIIIYVSCNPTTLSRDLVMISEAGYRPTAMQPVDLFPQTYHIETVVKFEKDEGGRMKDEGGRRKDEG